MRKLLYFLLLLSLLCFSGCREEEDVYNPKSRLSAIYDTEKSPTTPFAKFRYNKENQIEKVIFDEFTYFKMEYNPDNQVSKIIGYFNSESYGYVLVDYIDKKMSKISYYNNPNMLFQVDTFYRHRGTLHINLSSCRLISLKRVCWNVPTPSMLTSCTVIRLLN